MIDFRYHLVSIVAVFLALAVGIVLGSTELRGAALSALDRTSNALSQKLDAANNENSALQQEVSGDQAFAQAAEPVLLSHLLDGKRAVVITAPGAPSAVVNGITTALGDAGATVSGQVALSAKFADTSASNLSLLDQLTQRVAPSGLTLANGTPQQQAAQVLASALVSPDPRRPAVLPGPAGRAGLPGPAVIRLGSQAAQTILSSYSAGQFITVSGQPAQGATLAVIVTAATPRPAARPTRPTRRSCRWRRSSAAAARPPWWPARPPGRARAAPSRRCAPAVPRTMRPRWTTRMRSVARSLSFRLSRSS